MNLCEVREDKNIYILALGCSKNLVDAESMAMNLRDAGYRIVGEPDEAQAIVINTCGFIQPAKEEAIEAILSMADYKEGACECLAVTGCLAERYPEAIVEDLPEVDLILGVRSFYAIVEALDCFFSEECTPKIYRSRDPKDALRHLRTDRRPSTQTFAYLKIAEGCYHHCAYCAIPMIRGRHISRPMEDILGEARSLIDQGYQEIVLVAQDLSAYGLDLYGERRLVDLLRALEDLPGLKWLRTLYLYCDAITESFIQLMANSEVLCSYIDLPIQHASDRILKMMGRRETEAVLRETFAKLRASIPNVAIRTTVMVGFPGETEEDFQILLDFIKEARFEHLGCFIFSPEEGTRAAELPDQVEPDVAQSRYHRVMALQQVISQEIQESKLGEVVEVLIEGHSEDGLYYLARSAEQAPEVDGSILVLAPNYPLERGNFVHVKLLETDGYQFIATQIDLESVTDKVKMC